MKTIVRSSLVWTVIGFVALWGSARAQEHPMEHPSEGKTHTEQKIDLNAEFPAAVEGYVKKTLDEKGTLPVRDVHGKDVPLPGTLELQRIHKNRIVRYKDDTYFACSDFTVREGKKVTKIDLDFFMTKTAEGWTTDKILLHKINGKPRLTYVNNEPTPIEEKGE